MTFTDTVSDICDRLSLTSADDLARVGRAVNRIYKKIAADLGIKHVAKRATVSATCSIGVSTLTFTASEKPINVYNRNVTPYQQLIEFSLDELEAEMPFGASDAPTKYAVQSLTSDTVVILLNCIPQTAFDLYADVYATTATLSGTDEPAFPESAHDILIHGVLVDEYMKIEKPALSKLEEVRYRERMGELRLWVTVSTTRDIHQGKTAEGRQVGASSGGGSGSGVNGATSYTQTGLITFDRSAGGDVAPFAVAAAADAVVTNLDADKLDGQHGAFYQDAANLTNTAALTVDATQVTSGTLPDARLSSNVATLTGTQTFSGTKTFSALVNAASGIGASGVARVTYDGSVTNVNGPDGGGYFKVSNGQVFVNSAVFALGAGGAADVTINRDASDILALRRSTVAQEFRVWNTFTALTTGEFGKLEWAANVFRVGTEKGSVGGSARGLALVTDDVNRLTISATGDVATVGGLFERARTVAMGEWITVAYAAGNFTASTGNWTVDDADELVTYMLVGNTLYVRLIVNNSDVSATPSGLRVALPGGFTPVTRVITPVYLEDAGTIAIGVVDVNPSVAYLEFRKTSGNFTLTSSDNTAVHAVIFYEIA